MKQSVLIWFGVIILNFLGQNAGAADAFPVFSSAPIEVTIPTNSPGLLLDTTAAKSSTNINYHLTGQIFTNESKGHLQSKAEGFSGTSDKSTPWKTLTELFAVYEEGSPEEKLKSLYASSSQDVIANIYKNPAAKERFQKFGTTVTNAQALMWHGDESDGGSFAYVKVSYRAGRQAVMPFYLVKTDGKYELASKSFTKESPNNYHQNIVAFLQNKYAVNRP